MTTYNVGGGGYGSYNPGGGFGGSLGNLQGYTDWAQQPFNFEDFLSQLEGFSPGAFQALTDTAGGGSLTGNPYLDETFNQASGAVTDQFNNQVLPNIAAQFGGAGRTGGGLHHNAVSQSAGQLTDSLAGLSNQLYGGNYQLERDRQLGAAQGLFDLYNQGAGRHMQGLGLAGGLFSDYMGNQTQRNIASQANATQRYGMDQNDAFRRLAQAQNHALSSAGLGLDLYGMQLGQQNHALGMIPQFLGMGQQSDLLGAQGMLQAGDLFEGYQGRALQDQMDRWNFGQNAPWAHLGRYMDATGGNYGTTGTIDSSGTSSGRSTQRSSGGLFETLLGAGLTAAGLFTGNPALIAAGAGGGGVGASRNFGI